MLRSKWIGALVGLVLLIGSGRAEAAITFNADCQASTGSASTLGCSFAVNKPTTGDTVVVAISNSAATLPCQLNAPTTASNSYTELGTVLNNPSSNTNCLRVWRAENVTVSGTFTITEAPASTTQFTIIALAFSGMATVSFDLTAGQATTAANPTSTATTTTTQADEVVVGAMTNNSTSAVTASDTVSTNGAQSNNSALQDLFTQYRIISATGTQASTWTEVSDAYSARVGTFKASVAAASPPTRTLLGVGKAAS